MALSRGHLAKKDAANEVVVFARRTFEDFYRREYRPVVALAYALSGSRVGAEDLAQDAFIAAHKRWEQIVEYDKPEAWVRRVVANLAVSAFRKRLAETKALARMGYQRDEWLPEMAPDDGKFWKMVRGLPAKQAQAVTLFYLEDRPVNEIAAILECSPATAKVHLHRGRNSLAEVLSNEEGDGRRVAAGGHS
jgi:RNA polymerase sigma-70 factor (ECF subfamily)